MSEISLEYRSLQELIKPYTARNANESRAFLVWYLENLYRLEPFMAEEAVCDGPDDMGIDGLYVDDTNNRIDVLQSVLVKTATKTIGSRALREFSGTLNQLRTPEGFERIRDTTTNVELRGAITDLAIPELVRDGYTIRGVFVTNARPDPSATAFLGGVTTPISFVDRSQIESRFVPARHIPPATRPITFDVTGFHVGEYRGGSSERVFVVPVSGLDLIGLDGIQSGGLFDYNVRQYLGRTNVNRDIAKSLANEKEHANFLLYHNGITVVAEKVDTSTPDQLTIENYVVVNGCQSLSVLWDSRASVTSNLRILTRIIELDRSSPLMDKITHHSNNQNGIRPRDFQSNNPIQLRIRAEFAMLHGGTVRYLISRGEPAGGATESIDNELAARVLLTFDLERPWNAHETYKLFDELHADVFARPGVNATRILALVDLFNAASKAAADVKDSRLGGLTLAKFYLLYLLRRALVEDELGLAFIRDPADFVRTPDRRGTLREAAGEILADIVVDLNAEVADREALQGALDFKRLLKQEKEVRALTKDVMSSYMKAVRRGRSPSFAELWHKTP